MVDLSNLVASEDSEAEKALVTELLKRVVVQALRLHNDDDDQDVQACVQPQGGESLCGHIKYDEKVSGTMVSKHLKCNIGVSFSFKSKSGGQSGGHIGRNDLLSIDVDLTRKSIEETRI